jgi:hypothetical protein
MANIGTELLHSDISEQLSNWAERNAVSDDRIVQDLLQDFEAEENLNIWATMDPFEYLPQPAPVQGAKLLSWAKLTSTIRNVMVFVPVALTWEAVSKATEAFAKFVEANNATTVNFLEFWQNGYDVLPSFWTISHIATLDFLIILGVIALSLLSTFLNGKGSSLNKAELHEIEKDRLGTALALKMYLYSMREIDKTNIKEGVASSVSALLTATSSLSKSARQLSAVVAELQSGVPVINNFGIKLGKESEKLVLEVGSLTAALSGINSSITGDLKEAVETATYGLDLASTELNTSTHSLRANSKAAESEIKTLQSLIKKASRGK